jgi:hypothetical protein
MKSESAAGTATVKDYSEGKDGSNEIDVPYKFDFDVYENITEVNKDFSEKDLCGLATARSKSSANAAARTKAIKPYAQDPNSAEAVREELIKSAMKMKKTREQAERWVDSLAAAE